AGWNSSIAISTAGATTRLNHHSAFLTPSSGMANSPLLIVTIRLIEARQPFLEHLPRERVAGTHGLPVLRQRAAAQIGVTLLRGCWIPARGTHQEHYGA